MAEFPGFCEETYQDVSREFAWDQCVNLYPATGSAGKSKTARALVQVPGLSPFITLPGSPVRCLWSGDDRLFAVAGAKYGEIVAGPSFQDRGTLATGSLSSQIFSNGTQLLIVSGGKAYCDNGGAANGANAAEVGDAAWGAYLDGYGILLRPNSNDVVISALLNFLSWDPLDIQTRITTQDRLVGLWNHLGMLWLFGKRSIELWRNTGGADFPFERYAGANMNIGTEHPESIAEADNSLFFVSVSEQGGPRVYRTRGLSIERVSHYGVEMMMPPVGGDPVGWSYEQGGHLFYVVNFIGAAGTPSFVFDITENRWHTRGHWNGSRYDSYLGRCHTMPTKGYAPAGGTHLVGSRSSGKVYFQGPQHYNFDGTQIRPMRMKRYPASLNRHQFHHRFEVEMETGEQASGTPSAELRWSDDGGKTFGPPRQMSLGAAGDYTIRQIVRRLGKTRSRIYELSFPDVDGPVRIFDAYLEATPGQA